MHRHKTYRQYEFGHVIQEKRGFVSTKHWQQECRGHCLYQRSGWHDVTHLKKKSCKSVQSRKCNTVFIQWYTMNMIHFRTIFTVHHISLIPCKSVRVTNKTLRLMLQNEIKWHIYLSIKHRFDNAESSQDLEEKITNRKWKYGSSSLNRIDLTLEIHFKTKHKSRMSLRSFKGGSEGNKN
jgi:hypothetical protein